MNNKDKTKEQLIEELNAIQKKEKEFEEKVAFLESKLERKRNELENLIESYEGIQELAQHEQADQIKLVRALEVAENMAHIEQIEKDKIIREMRRQLEMARRIQRNLIPAESPSPDVAFFYKPMDEVGGDFFDFIEFDDPNKLGLLVTDVSGHGVPSAFITSMVKSFILQAKELVNDPGELLFQLNGFLVDQIDRYFVTAFYGIFDKEKNTFTYANAGHNVPYVITMDKIEQLSSKNIRNPIGMIDNETLVLMKKKYSNLTYTLDHNSKLFLYTDGLTETINLKDKDNPTSDDIVDFGSNMIDKVFNETKESSSQELVDIMMERLIEFRGSNKFDDDVCMICLHIGE